MELRRGEDVVVDGPQQAKVTQGFLSFWAVWLVVGTVLLAWVVTHRYRQRNYLGPKTWPLIGCFLELTRNFDVLHDWLLGYFRGGILTFPVPFFFLNNTFTACPVNVEYILKTKFSNYPKGELLRGRFVDMMGHGIFNVDGDEWRHQRRVVTLEFSSSKLRDYSIHAFRAGALKLAHVLSNAAKRQQPVDIQDCFMRLTLDSICKIGFGVDIGCLEPSLPALPFASSFDEANRLIVRRYIDMFWRLKRALNIGGEGRLKVCLRTMNTFLYNVIDSRRAEMQTAAAQKQEQGVDILSRFMTLSDGDEAYTDERLRDVVINFIIAGRDTTALTLSWFFYELSRNPQVVDNILSELDTVVGSDEDCPNADKESAIVEFAGRLNYTNLSKLQYLQAALTEALRFYPAVPLESKVSLVDDRLPDGTLIEQGKFVSYSSYAMGRMKSLWGPDVMEFKPERWLKNGIFQSPSPFKMTAFQAGPRICLGKDSAYMQMKMTTAILLKFFRFGLVPGEPPPTYYMMVVLYIANGLRIGVTQK